MNHRHLQYKVTQKPGCPPPHHTTHREMLLSHEMNLRNSINEIANLIYGAVTFTGIHQNIIPTFQQRVQYMALMTKPQ